MDWTGARYADTPTVEVTTWVAAAPERVWALVRDVELMPELSDELQHVEWLDGVDADTAVLGSRFRGRSRHRAIGEWTTTSQIAWFDPPSVFGWTVGDPDNPTAAWRFTLVAEREGTGLTQWARLGPGPSGLTAALTAMPDKEQKIVFNRLCEWEAAMTRTLAGIKARAESRPEPSDEPSDEPPDESSV